MSHGWISAARSSIFAAKTIAFVGFVVFDLWLSQKSYMGVGHQTIYLKTPNRSPSNVPRAGNIFGEFCHTLHAPPYTFTRAHALSHACWHHCWRHPATSALVASSTNVIPATSRWRNQVASLLTSLAHVIADVIFSLTFTSGSWLFQHWLWLLESWPLTFSRVDFCSPGAPYPVFCIDFIFAVHFCILCF